MRNQDIGKPSPHLISHLAMSLVDHAGTAWFTSHGHEMLRASYRSCLHPCCACDVDQKISSQDCLVQPDSVTKPTCALFFSGATIQTSSPISIFHGALLLFSCRSRLAPESLGDLLSNTQVRKKDFIMHFTNTICWIGFALLSTITQVGATCGSCIQDHEVQGIASRWLNSFATGGLGNLPNAATKNVRPFPTSSRKTPFTF